MHEIVACGEAVAAAASVKGFVGLVATMPVVSDSPIGSAVVVVVARSYSAAVAVVDCTGPAGRGGINPSMDGEDC